MRLSIICVHFKTWRLTPACIWHFKTYGMPEGSEFVLVNNSVGHPSIKAITETEIGDGIRVVDGRPDFMSHGMGYCMGYQEANNPSHVLLAETDSWPLKNGWFEPYMEASKYCDLAGPLIPQSSGPYIHPAGALVSRKILDAIEAWQDRYKDWVFVPGGGIVLGTSSRPYHVVIKKSLLDTKSVPESLQKEIDLWNPVCAFQEMRTFDEDSFETYGQRTGGTFDNPTKDYYNKIGLESGQFISWFAKANGFRVLEAPTHIKWMDGFHGKQAEWSTVYDSFIHYWGLTTSAVAQLDPKVMKKKHEQIDQAYAKLPEKIRRQIEQLERDNPT